ncbi:glycosyltransferase, partial [Candidatus Micrarchaeota archaeon]|nr:glycosyltransferase [Candidatus Micrarchaeota archaeon]
MISPQDTFGELVQSTKEFRKKKANGLIIMPFYRAYDYLFKHLELLEAQTFQDFDLLIVLNSLSDEKKVLDFINQNKFGYGIIVAKRKEDTGSAGGFFTGEKYALENGYKYIIITDDDCLPVNKRHIETLVEEHRKGNPLVY